MYQRFAEQARTDGDLNAAALFTEIAADEGSHRDAFLKALTVINTGRGTIPAPPKVDVVEVPAGLPKVRAARTLTNLNTAMHGEALAHAKYMLFATRTEAERQQGARPAVERHRRSGVAGALRRRGRVGRVRAHHPGEPAQDHRGRAVRGDHDVSELRPAGHRRRRHGGDRFFLDTAKDEAGHAAAFRKPSTGWVEPRI